MGKNNCNNRNNKDIWKKAYSKLEEELDIGNKKFSAWLRNKAQKLRKRDVDIIDSEKRKRPMNPYIEHFDFESYKIVAFPPKAPKIEYYQDAVSNAIINGNPQVDYFTNMPLNWHLIGKYHSNNNNINDDCSGRRYRELFLSMPTFVWTMESGKRKLVICSWRVNDARNDATDEGFLEICKAVVEHYDAL